MPHRTLGLSPRRPYFRNHAISIPGSAQLYGLVRAFRGGFPGALRADVLTSDQVTPAGGLSANPGHGAQGIDDTNRSRRLARITDWGSRCPTQSRRAPTDPLPAA